MAKRGRPPKTEKDPKEVFIEYFESETNNFSVMEARFVEAATLWKARHNVGIPYKNFYAFKASYYRSIR